MPWTNFGKDKLLGPCGGVPTTFPGTWHLALVHGNPGPTGTVSGEPSAGAYTRVAVANNISEWDGPQAGGANNARELINVNNIIWPESTAAWGNVTYVAGMDAASGGTMWWYYAIPGGTINVDRAGVSVVIEIGTLELQLEDPTT